MGWLLQISHSLFKTAFTLKGSQMQNVPTSTATQAASFNTASINLTNFGYPVNVFAVDSAMVASHVTPIDELKSLETSRITWETTELAASNRRLYAILTKAYSYYLTMKQDSSKDVRTAHMDAMNNFIKEHGYIINPSSHDMTRVVKCVFGVDRRRVSAYSIALRAALQQNITADELAAFLEDNGGVEQLRLGGKKALSATERADIVKQAVINNSIGTFKFDALLTGADADWIDKQVVIVATYLPTGEFVANAVIKHESAVTAALAAHQSLLNAKARAEVKAENEAKKAAEKEEKAAADVEAAALAAQAKAEKQARQMAKNEAEALAAKEHFKYLEHANTLFDGVIA